MAIEKITVKFEPDGNDRLVAAIRKLNTETRKLTGETKGATKASGVLDAAHRRNQKSAQGLGGTFSVLRSKILLASFAITSTVGILSKLGRAIVDLQARNENVTRAFENLSAAANFSDDTLEKLTEAVGGTISSLDLMTQANNALLLGIFKSNDQMAEMFDIAQRLSKALGKDALFGVESLVTGLGRQSKLMLDNLGIVLDVEKAYSKYAEKNNLLASELDDVQRKQAFVNEAMRKARELIKATGEELPTAKDRYDEFGASLENFSVKLSNFFAPEYANFVDFMKAKNKELADNVDENFEETGDSVIRVANRWTQTVTETTMAWDLARLRFGSYIEKVDEFNIKAASGVLHQEALKKVIISYSNEAQMAARATGQIGEAMTQLAGKNKDTAIFGMKISAAAAIADSIAGASKMFAKGGFAGYVGGVALLAQMMVRVNTINTQIRTLQAEKFEQGGLIGGNRHSQGGTMINAEQGEFVMNRKAVDSIGVNNLNNMNEGGGGAITVNINGGMISQEFVENELAEAISTAARRGANFGIS